MEAEALAISATARRREGLVAHRVSRLDEMEYLRPLLEAFHAESRYAHLPFSQKKFEQGFLRALKRPDDVLMAYILRGGETVGAVHAGVGDYYLSESGRMATVYGIYTPPVMRRSLLGGKLALKLIRIVTDWAKAQGAEELHIWSNAGIDAERTDRMLRKVGFEMYGGNYVARVIG